MSRAQEARGGALSRGRCHTSDHGALRRSIAGNHLTGIYGDDMSGVKAIAAALPNTQISDLKCALAQ